MTDLKNNELWYQLSFKDENNLSGINIFHFLKPLREVTKVHPTVVDDMEGAFNVSRLPNGKIFDFDALLLEVKNVVQFDWAFFYINFLKKGISQNLQTNFENSEIIIRLVDSTYIYLYCRKKAYIEALMSNSNPATMKHCAFEQLDISY